MTQFDEPRSETQSSTEITEADSRRASQNQEDDQRLLSNHSDSQHDSSLLSTQSTEHAGPESWKIPAMGYWVYALTYLGQFAIYLIRKPVLTAKPYIRQEFLICSKFTLALIDNCVLVPFSLWSILLPNVVDLIGGKNGLGLAYIGSGLFIGLVWVFQYLSSAVSTEFAIFCLLVFGSGSFQAFCWPSCIRIQSEQMPLAPRKALFPIWVTCCYIGSTVSGVATAAIYAALGVPKSGEMEDQHITDLATGRHCNVTQVLYVNKPVLNVTTNTTYMVPHKVDWRLTYGIPALIPMALGILALMTVPVVKPKAAKDAEEDEQPLIEAEKEQPPSERTPPRSIQPSSPSDCSPRSLPQSPKSPNRSILSHDDMPLIDDLGEDECPDSAENPAVTDKVPMLQLLREVPGMRYLSAACFCSKSARYWFLYWCPTWLVDVGEFNPAVGSALSTALDIGSILMLLSLGPLTTKNKCMKRPIPPLYAVAVAGVLCAPMILIAGFAVKTGDVLIVAPILFVLGTLVVVYHPVIAGVAINDCCEVDGRNVHGGVSGFVNGMGSLGSVIVSLVASWLADYDYNYALAFVAFMFIIGAIFSVLAHRAIEAGRRARLSL